MTTKSNKQRAAELKSRRAAREQKRAQRIRDDAYAFRLATRPELGSALVNPELLAADGRYVPPDFVARGYYLDRPFDCRDCGKTELWTATQQKWWYETAKGGVRTRAVRCRPCRRRERERATEHKRASEEGRQRKAGR